MIKEFPFCFGIGKFSINESSSTTKVLVRAVAFLNCNAKVVLIALCSGMFQRQGVVTAMAINGGVFLVFSLLPDNLNSELPKFEYGLPR